MNILVFFTMQILNMAEGAGGLFDFNGTLPLMAIQFILLSLVLTFVFYKPVSTFIDTRENYINTTLIESVENLKKAATLSNKYNRKVLIGRLMATRTIVTAEEKAEERSAKELEQIRKELATLLDSARKEVLLKKADARRLLEPKIGKLARLIEQQILDIWTS